ncbi:MAG: Cna domain protein, partial [Acidobacteria bacterium]|nr:Cna domain protein [Acidobacteriota bacterium]
MRASTWKPYRVIGAWLAFLFLTFVAAPPLQAQTASTGTVLGMVKDPSGAIVPGAGVELIDTATQLVRTTVTNEAGRYTFTAVRPGTYSVTAAASGFQKAVIPSLAVEISKSYTIDFQLKIGQSTEQVVVTASAGAELQTLDATVGDTLGGLMLELLPSIDRNVTSLLLLQPSATPVEGEGTRSSRYGGQVAGAQSDQNVYVLDGGNITSGVSGNSDYWNNFNGTSEGAIPTPSESIREFRVGTTNQMASFSGAGGSQVMLVTKSGTDQYHGSVYDYLQNDNLNSNSWQRNRLNQVRPETRDNRFGASLGGPLPWLHDRMATYFFFNYEGRRRRDYTQVTRTVPTDTLKQGILRFRDGTGNIISYNLKTSSQCGSAGNLPCDPRGIGLNPAINEMWSSYMPPGNDTSTGDGLNTIGFSSPVSLPNNSDFAVLRLDHSITQNWAFTGSYRYYTEQRTESRQTDIGGFVSGNEKGKAVSTAVIPREPRYLVFGLTGAFTPMVTTETNFSYLRDYWYWQTDSARPQISGIAAALSLPNDMTPTNLTIGNIRRREWNGHHYTLSENMAWVKGVHLLQFGGSYRRNAIKFWRDDQQSALTVPMYFIASGSGINIPATNRPPACSGAVTTNCLPSAQVSTWNSLYTAVLGMTDRAVQVGTRDGSLNANPIGTPPMVDKHYPEFSLYLNDSWKVTPTLTLNLGLNWSADLPQTEVDGKESLGYYLTGELIDPEDYFARRKLNNEAGGVYNPAIGWQLINSTDRKYPYDPVWTNFAPRVSVAWNPSFTDGFLGRLFGDKKTVVRTGFARLYDRLNGVHKVINPIQVYGFSQALLCLGPSINGSCLGTSGVNPITDFRIGIDGNSIDLLRFFPETAPSPMVPGVSGFPGANQAAANDSLQMTPNYRPATHNSFTLSLQRELPGRSILEIGYIHRDTSGLTTGLSLNQVPYFMRQGGQSFAEAFDAMALALSAGQTVAPQPFLETILAGSSYCAAPNASCTAGVLARFSGNVRSYQYANLFNSIQTSFVTGPATARATQVLGTLNYFADVGASSYDGGFISVKTRGWKGLSMNANFTYAHALDNGVVNQDIDNFVTNSYDLGYTWDNSLFDRRFVFNLMSAYTLPARTGAGAFNYIFQGWSVSPIFSWYSGLPLRVAGGGQELNGAGAVLTQPNTF